jgi:tetratricopeptide (TPR) repeat protein
MSLTMPFVSRKRYCLPRERENLQRLPLLQMDHLLKPGKAARTMINRDLYGNATTLAGNTALLHWNAAIEAVLAHARSAPDELAGALAADPLFAQGHAARGLMLLTLARAELVAQASACLDTARDCARLRPPLPREQLYLSALAAWLGGEPLPAAELLEQALAISPRDVLAFKLAQAIRFMCGDVQGMARSGARVVETFADGSPTAGYVRGCQAFALEETGLYAEAEAMGREAVILAPRDAWGRHAVAHCFEMTGRARQGVDWLASSQSWRHCSNFGFHLHWHMALFQLELGEIEAVLALYDTAVRAAPTDDFRDLANAASLLQRLELEGVAVGERWEELARIAEARVDDRRLVFADLHYMLALLGAGREARAGTIAAHLLRDARRAASHDSRVAGVTGVATAQGVMAFHRGDYAEAASLLRAGAGQRQQAGGSHAQRDVFELMALESLVRAGDAAQAERLLQDRLARRGGRNRFASERLGRIAAGRAANARLGALLVGSFEPAIHH